MSEPHLSRDPWKVLGVTPRATIQEIKRAYRKKARLIHPDTSSSPGDVSAFVELRRAFEALMREFRVLKPAAGTDTSPPPGNDSGFNMCDGAFLFLEVSAREAFSGEKVEVLVTDQEAFCPRCGGTGNISGSGERPCSTCGGSGHQEVPWGDERLIVVCRECGGTGFMDLPICNLCRGRGRVSRQRKVFVPIPRGTRTGTLLKLPGQGPWRPELNRRDPLYVEIRVNIPGGISITGLDTISEAQIDVWSALAGTEIQVETMDGPASCVVPPGTSEGSILRIKGKGWVDETGQRGDHVVRLRIKHPSGQPGPKAQRLLDELRRAWPVNGFFPRSLPKKET